MALINPLPLSTKTTCLSLPFWVVETQTPNPLLVITSFRFSYVVNIPQAHTLKNPLGLRN